MAITTGGMGTAIRTRQRTEVLRIIRTKWLQQQPLLLQLQPQQ
jgi:hypothetical protein